MAAGIQFNGIGRDCQPMPFGHLPAWEPGK
jgi:hypothetical protein